MKKLFSQLGLTLLILFLFTCATTNEKMELNLKVGSEFKQTTKINSAIKQNIYGQDVDTTVTTNVSVTYKVLKVESNRFEIECTYDRLGTEMEIYGQKIVYDTNDTSGNDSMNSIFRNLVNKKFIIVMDKRGQIIEVKNIDEIFNHLFDGISEISDNEKEAIKEQMEQSYGSENLKKNFQSSGLIFSDKAIREGETWTNNSEFRGPMSAKVLITYTLKENQKDAYIVTGLGTFETLPNENSLVTNGMTIEYNLKGKIVSEIIIDKKTGWIKNSKIIQNASGELKLPEESGVVPMSFVNEITIE